MKNSSILLLLASTLLRAEEPGVDAVRAGLGINRGLIVQVGAEDGSLASALAQADPVVVFAIARNAAAETAIRERLVRDGVHGQATVALPAEARLPLTDNLASGLVADLDLLPPGLPLAELLRVVQPGGRLWLRRQGQWSQRVKERPADLDDWGQYYYDAAMSELSKDRQAGPARGIQWQSGPQDSFSEGIRISGRVSLFLETVPGQDKKTLVARDAFNGLPLWRRPDLMPMTRFALMADRSRVYIHPTTGGKVPSPAMLALDAATGETVLEYLEGITFVLPEGGWPRNDKDPVRQDLSARSKDLQARLTDDGKLLQAGGPEMVVLDAASGKRLWARTAEAGKVWGHPIVKDGAVYVVEGREAPSYSYTHWPVLAVERVRCFDLASGKDRWTYQPPGERPVLAAYNMTLGAGRLALVSRDLLTGKGKLAILFLSATDGRETDFLENGISAAGKSQEIGGGHSGARGHAIGDRLFVSTITTFPGSISMLEPGNASLDNRFAKYGRPVGCTVYRHTENWTFGSLTTYAMDGSRLFHTNAARTACDVGAFPANGLSYITPNHCFCLPYLPGSAAFHSRVFAGEEKLERLETGAAKAPVAPLETDGNSAWPMFLGNNERGAWVDDKLPETLRPIWQTKPAGDAVATGLIADAWAGHWYAQGPATQASVAGGRVVVAASHRQQIVAYDAATGAERWRANVDGRVDTAPTLAGGMVVAGTRNGYVYALRADTGELVWRFLAAPRRERISADGQLESPWPVLGTVNVNAEGVWAFAGRHTESDGGMWWYRLDLASGKTLAQGRFGADELQDNTIFGGGLANAAVLSGKYYLLPGLRLEREGEGLRGWSQEGPPGEWEGWQSRYRSGVLVPGNQGLINRIETMGGYKLANYGLTSARLYAYKGNDFAMVGGSPAMQHRGGNADSTLRAMRRLPEMETYEVPDSKDPNRKHKRTRGSEIRWMQNNLGLGRDNGIRAIAVAGDALLVGLEVTNRDRWKERAEMPYRLQVLAFADGTVRQQLALPRRPLPGGISSDDGRVFVVSEDGTLSAFGP